MENAGQRPQQGRTPPPRPPPPGVTAASEDSRQVAAAFRSFQKLHDKAFAAVDRGLSADSEGDLTAAEQYYTEGFALLERILDVDTENLPGASANEKDQAKLMQQKVNKTKWQVTYRLEALRGDTTTTFPSAGTNFSYSQGDQLNSADVRLPSYEEAVSEGPTSLNTSSLMSDAALGDSIMAAEYPCQSRSQVSIQGTELYSIPEGVQVFHITGDGLVSAPSYPTSLRIVQIGDPMESGADLQHGGQAPPAFLQVGEWFYPLFPGASPVLHTSYGAYIFPDLSPEGREQGAAVGLMLPPTITQEETRILEDILHNFSALQDQQSQLELQDLVIPSAPQEATAPKEVVLETEEQGFEEETTASKISKGISIASQWISWGVGKGAEKAVELIAKGSEKLRERIKPEEQPKPVDPRVQKGMLFARKATSAVVSVSGYVVSKLGEATMALGREVAPYIRKKGEQIMPSLKSKESKSKIDSIVEVAGATLHGFGTVYMSLEGAAKALAKGLANETVTVVDHTYGPHAGKLTENTLYTVGNCGMTGYNIQHLGIKAIAKRAAKDAGVAVIENISEERAATKASQSSSVGNVNGAASGASGKKQPM